MEGHLFLARREREAECGPQCGVPTVEDCGRLSEQADHWHPRKKASKVSFLFFFSKTRLLFKW